MGREIERKFLLAGDAWRRLGTGILYRQGYLSSARGCTVRVRTVGARGYLTVKGPSVGAARSEYEYEIPCADAEAMFRDLCERPLIEKIRYKVDHGGFTWEIDEFSGENEGLVVAEIELDREDQPFPKPDWIGEEVTHDPRYFNANLIRHPYSHWS